MRARTLGAGCWLIAAVTTVAVDPLAAWRSPVAYSPIHQAISDLGVTRCGPIAEYGGEIVEICSPWWPLVDGGWIVSGLLVALGAVLLRRTLGLSGPTVTLFVLAGLMLTSVGAVPADVHSGLHALFGLLGFLLQNVAILWAGWRLRAVRPALGRLGIGAGLIGLIASLVMLTPPALDQFGLWERIGAYAFPLWLIAAAFSDQPEAVEEI